MDAVLSDAQGRPRRPARSEGVRALVLLGSGLAVAIMVALLAQWRYNHQLERAAERYRLTHPGVVIPTGPRGP